jgi:DNA (cytosine-5)-methyltransferase 1
VAKNKTKVSGAVRRKSVRTLAYYNENDPNTAAWLRELIRDKQVAQGEVDERSIIEVRAKDLKGYTQCHFFAGIGVWSFALRSAGWSDERPVWSGSCPCQPFSSAGKTDEFDDERHLWPAWFGLIKKCRPDVCFGEQVASKLALAWLDLVCTDLESENYSVGALDTCAASVGAPHIRQRIFFVGDSNSPRSRRWRLLGSNRERNSFGEFYTRPPSFVNGFWSQAKWTACRDDKMRAIESGVAPLVARTPGHVVKLRGYGNCLNAEVAKEFIQAYLESKEKVTWQKQVDESLFAQ